MGGFSVFLPDGKLDGFDAWRLYWFIEENQLEDPVPTLEEIKTGLEHLHRPSEPSKRLSFWDVSDPRYEKSATRGY